jgi:acetyl esterase/lipase
MDTRTLLRGVRRLRMERVAPAPVHRFFRLVLAFLLVFWVTEASALSGVVSVQDLIKFLNDYRNSGNLHKQSLAADLQQKLAQSGVTFTDSGLLISGPVPPVSGELAQCNDLRTLSLGAWVLSGGMLFGPGVLPLTGDVGGGAWSAFLDGNATTFGFSVDRGNLGVGVTVGGSLSANASGTLHWSEGFWEPEIKCNFLLGCWVEPVWKCRHVGDEGFSVAANGNFNARLALSLDASLERGSDGRYRIFLGRQALAIPTGPLTGSSNASVNVRIATDFKVDAPLWNYLAGSMVGDVGQRVDPALQQRISASNAQIRAQLPVVYELPDVDPLVRRLVAEIVDSPTLHRFVEQHFQEIVFYLLVNDPDALRQLVTSSAACEATKLVRAGMPMPPLFTNAPGSCVAADPDGPDQGRYFSDPACTRELAFRPTPYAEACSEVLTPAPNPILGNAALWTPDANQPNDPLPSVPSRKWTLSHGARADISVEALAGKTVPLMKRVRFRDISTSSLVANGTPLSWGCVAWSLSADADTCKTWGARSGAPALDFTVLGYIKASAEAGTVPLYWGCTVWNFAADVDTCRTWGPQIGSAGADFTLLGYIRTSPALGTVPLYYGCVRWDADGNCTSFALGTNPALGTLVGHLYAGATVNKPACALEMRIYKKDATATGLPALLAFHGGKWQFRGGAFAGLESTIAHYTEQGFVVFAPFYRLAGNADGNFECNEAPWQEIARDAEAALDWVKVNGTAFGAKPAKPAVMGQSAGAHLAGWLVTHRPTEVAAGFLLYAPSDVRDFLAQARPGGLYEAFQPSLDILSVLAGADVRTIDVNNSDFARENSFHDLVRVASGSMPPVFLAHGVADTLVPSNQSVLFCNAYGGSAVNSGGGLARRAIYTCGMWGGRLHLFEQGQHALDACLTTDVPGLCFAGDTDSRLLAADSMRQARAFLASNVNQAPTANAGADQTVSRSASVTLGGAGADADGTIASYSWTQTAGPTVTLLNANTANPTFTAPYVTAATLLTFRLTVTDNRGATGSATVNVTVTVPAPVAIPNLTPAYWGCVAWSFGPDNDTCSIWGLQTGSAGADFTFLGYLKTAPEPGTAPVYWGCTAWRFANDNDRCINWGPQVGYDPGGFTFVAYIKTSAEAGTTPLYYGCVRWSVDGDCTGSALSTSPVGGAMGYIYNTTTLPPN